MADPTESEGHPMLGWIIGSLIVLAVVAGFAAAWIHVHGV
jgi:hypothetical protein